MRTAAIVVLTALLGAAPAAYPADLSRADEVAAVNGWTNCLEDPAPPARANPLLQRLLQYTQLSVRHRVEGLASYYSTFFDGRKTANGEIYRNRQYSAAHLTLPLGTWIEVTSRATGRKLRLRVNDRGPYVKKFCLDLSQAAAHYLGVDRATDRHVEIRIIALPGEEPLPDEVLAEADATAPAAVVAAASGSR